MNPMFDSVNPSDVMPNEALRQSELVSRMAAAISLELGEEGTTSIELAINQWLLDNNLVIKADQR